MNILVVCQYFWPEAFRINDVCEGLIERGHKITVLTGIPNYPEGRFFKGYGYFKNLRQVHAGIKIVRMPLIPRMKGKSWQLALNGLSFAFFSSIFSLFACREKYDLIFVYQLSPVTMAIPAIIQKKFKKIPIVLYILDLWPESLTATGALKPGLLLTLVSKLVRYIYEQSDKILVSSRGFISQVKSMGQELSKVSYWPQWAEELYQQVSAQKDSPEISELPKGFKVMFAGNIGAAQGFETIVAAAEKLKNYPEIHWVILGDGRMKSWVEVQITLRGLTGQVHLLGRKPVETMPQYFSLADAMLVSLKKDPIFSITLPGKVQSYLACGKPIIAAIDGEGASVVNEAKVGFTCSADDADGLAQIVLKMYQTTEKDRDQMGQNALSYFEENFKRNKLLDQLENWFVDKNTEV